MLVPLEQALTQALQSLSRLEALLERERGALDQNDAGALERFAAEKARDLAPLSALLKTIQQTLNPKQPGASVDELRSRLERCQERNRANGLLMNLQAQRLKDGAETLGVQQIGYGRKGETPLYRPTRPLGAC